MKQSLFAVACVVALTLTSCRTSQRKNFSTDQPVTVSITISGASNKDIERYQLTPQLKRCADTVGSLKSGSTYQFTATQLKKDTECDVRLTGPLASEAGVSFFSGTEDGVYYEAENVVLGADETGALVADAYMQKNFTSKISPNVSTWKIYAAFTSETSLSTACTCRIQCDPTITNDAALVSKLTNSNKQGHCVFDNAADSEASGASCIELVVQCASTIYLGRWPSAVSIETTGGKVNTLPQISIAPAALSEDGEVILKPEINKTPKA